MKNLIKKERAKIAQQKAHGSDFVGRNVVLYYFFTWGLYPATAILSALTAGSAVFTYLNRSLQNPDAALAATIGIVLVLEVAVFFLGSSAMKDLRQNVFADNINHKVGFGVKAAGFLAVFTVSVLLSVTGAPDWAGDLKQQRDPLAAHQVSTDSINAVYDGKIAAERLDIERAEKMTWKGAIIRDGRNLIAAAKSNIAEYEDDRRQAIATAAAKNAEIAAEYNDETATTQNWVTRFAGISQLLQLLVLIFSTNYFAGAEKETPDNGAPATAANATAAVNNGGLTMQQLQQLLATAAVNNGAPQQPTTAAPEPPQRRIGFELPTPTPTRPTAASGGSVPIDNCRHCGAQFEKVVWNKVYCSEDCKLDFHAAKHGGRRFSPNMKRIY